MVRAQLCAPLAYAPGQLLPTAVVYVYARQPEPLVLQHVRYDLGSKRFLTYYLICGVGAGLMQLGVNAIEGGWALTVGASGAVYGLLLAYGMLHPNNTIMLMFPPIALKAKWLVLRVQCTEYYSHSE